MTKRMNRHLMRCPLAYLASLFLASTLSAQTVTVSGTVRYSDRVIAMNGWTTAQPFLPVRRCRVEARSSTNALLGLGVTNESGSFTFTADSASVVTVSILAQADSASVNVRDDSLPNDPIWSFTLGVRSNPTGSWNLGITQMGALNSPTGGGFVGQPFNILDEVLKTVDHVGTLGGGSLGTINVRWPRDGSNPGTSAYFGNGLIRMGQDDCYDDSIIQHELGHLVMDRLSQSQSPGGQHFICGTTQDERLSWSEGWATFWGENVRRAAGDAGYGAYVDTTGRPPAPGASNLSFSYRLEDATNGAGNLMCQVQGMQSELAVQCGLWDLTDTPADYAGIGDDDAFNGTVNLGLSPEAAAFNVVTIYLDDVVTTTGLHFGNFFYGWWVRGYMPNRKLQNAFVDTLEPWRLRWQTWVDADAGSGGNGWESNPYNSVATAGAGVGHVYHPPGATLLLDGDTYDEVVTIDDVMVLDTQPGTGDAVIR